MKRILFFILLSAVRLNAQELTTISTFNQSPALEQRLAGDDTTISDEVVSKPAKVYKMNYKTVVPIIVVGFAATAYSFSVIYKKPNTPDATILALNKDNIPAFDRWATQFHDLNMDRISYYPFYAVMPLPAILFIDKKMRKDAGRISIMYLEAFAFTGVIYGSSVYFVDRYRPDVYNTTLPMSYRHNGNYRNSFFAGHVAVMATSTFFMAKVYDDYHPESSWKWVIYGGAAAATIGMGYMRLEAGKHFPSDILTGAIVGVTSGLLTPALHKTRSHPQKWSVAPALLNNGSTGFSFTYKL